MCVPVVLLAMAGHNIYQNLLVLLMTLYGKNKSALLISKFSLVLHVESLIMVVGQVECSCSQWLFDYNHCKLSDNVQLCYLNIVGLSACKQDAGGILHSPMSGDGYEESLCKFAVILIKFLVFFLLSKYELRASFF